MIGPYISDLTPRPYQKISEETRLRVLLKAIDDLQLGLLTTDELAQIADRARP